MELKPSKSPLGELSFRSSDLSVLKMPVVSACVLLIIEFLCFTVPKLLQEVERIVSSD
jgi:hypothetical protein